jgi:hypothetical protein
MGCDIHCRVQVFENGTWKTVRVPIFPPTNPKFDEGPEGYWNQPTTEPFNWRHYGMFGFLADVRNYSHVPPIAECRGLPPDMGMEDYLGDHSFSWINLEELLRFNYEQTFEDRRNSPDGNGAADAGIGNGKITTFREFLGPIFFRDLAIMRCLKEDYRDVRVVFGFDS